MGLGFFYLIFSARYLGPELFGLLTFGLAFTGIFGLLLDLGLNNLAIREVARDKSRANVYLSNITFIKLLMGVVTFGLIAVDCPRFRLLRRNDCGCLFAHSLHNLCCFHSLILCHISVI